MKLKNKVLFELVSYAPQNYWLRFQASKFLIIVDKQSNAYFNIYRYDDIPIDELASKLEKHNEKTKSDLDKFYDEIDDSTVLSTFNYIEEYGTKKQKEILVEIEDRYKKTSLLIEDTINLIDWYEKMCDFYKNNDLED